MSLDVDHALSKDGLVPVSVPEARGSQILRYSGTNQIFHWVTALLIFTIIILGWLMAAGGATVEMLPLWEWHKTLGLIVLLITGIRIVWRFIDPPPACPQDQPNWDRAISSVTYGLFFIALIVMPLSGYMISAGAGFPPKLFDVIATPALIAKNKGVLAVGKQIHLAGQWAIYGLIAMHLAGVFYHVALVRDRVLERMLPAPKLAERSKSTQARDA